MQPMVEMPWVSSTGNTAAVGWVGNGDFICWCLENIGKYHFFRQLWLVLGVKLMEINSNLFSRWLNQPIFVEKYARQIGHLPHVSG